MHLPLFIELILIKEIEAITKRRLLLYAADIKKPDSNLRPEDKTGFSDLIQGVNEGSVDIMLNSPGGFAEVTEAIVGMLRSEFNSVRFAIPNMAKSAATLMALSGDELLMDHRSELGPIDPQVEYRSVDGPKREAAEDIIDGFKEAKAALIKEGPNATPAYVPLLNNYTMGFLRGCENAMKLSKILAESWLKQYMFKGDNDKPVEISRFFSSRKESLSHSRAIGIEKALDLGLKIVDLRKPENKELGEKLWELWCTCELHFERTAVYKLYENSSGCTLQKQVAVIQLKQGEGNPLVPALPPKPQRQTKKKKRK